MNGKALPFRRIFKKVCGSAALFKQTSSRLNGQLRLPECFTTMNGAVEIQRSGETQCTDLAFVDLGNTADEIFDAGIGNCGLRIAGFGFLVLRLRRPMSGKALPFRKAANLSWRLRLRTSGIAALPPEGGTQN